MELRSDKVVKMVVKVHVHPMSTTTQKYIHTSSIEFVDVNPSEFLRISKVDPMFLQSRRPPDNKTRIESGSIDENLECECKMIDP